MSTDHRHAHDGGSGHAHGLDAGADRRYLLAALGLLAAFMIAEVIVALASGSLALLSDAGHMLSDVGAIGAALWAMRLAARPATGAWTFGWKRAEILSAAANGITLLVIAGIVAAEAIGRLIHPPRVDGGPMVAVAAAGIVVNIAAAWVLAQASRSSLNVQGAFRHVLTDLYGFVGTVVAGIVILATGWTRADAVASLVVVALMLKAAWELLAASGRILLEAAPAGLDPARLGVALAAVAGVREVHDLHVWQIGSDQPALSAHVLVAADRNCHDTRRALEDLLHDGYGIRHTTLQVDHAGGDLLQIGQPPGQPSPAD
jgi:cobalt-zinc-cadmium efflux system protein